MRADEAYKLMVGHFLMFGHYPTSTRLGEMLGVTRQRAHAIIQDLVRLGKVKYSSDGAGEMQYDYRPLLLNHQKEIMFAWSKDKYGPDMIKRYNK
jgi:hypothetical protein